MKAERAVWLHEHAQLSLEEFCECSGLSEAELRELVDCGAIAPVDARAVRWAFRADLLVFARSAHRLRKDFELDTQAIALALTLLERIRDLEAELRDLRARLPDRRR